MKLFQFWRAMCARFLPACLLGVLFALTAGQAQAGERVTLSLDRGWLFHLGDVPVPEIRGHGMSYHNGKAGSGWGAAAPMYDDSAWRKVDLPHDWAVEGPFDPAANAAQGYRPRGMGWYRRHLRIDEAARGQHVELQFDAIATHSTVWVNGHLVNRNWSGYNSTRIDITPYLQYGDIGNMIAVKVDANAMEGWWYEGAGMYRHTWLIQTDPVHVVQDGVHATPRQIKGDQWSVPVEVTLNNSGNKAAKVTVDVTLEDPQGKVVGRRSAPLTVPMLGNATAQLPLTISAPALWSLGKTNLYKVTTRVRQAGAAIDEVALQTGFRSLRFDGAKGFFLNGEHVKLQGVCIHQDHAGVGVAVPAAIWEYRLRRLKELGVNAIRFSHNAVASEIMDMTDRMGFLVMDENRNFNPSPDYMQQLEWLVKRDRHHPSVILWSVFNEEPAQGTEVGYELVRRMVARVKALDDTRPVTAAMNGGLFSKVNVSQAVDVVGANYQVPDYDRYHKENPGKPFTSSEDTSAFMTRGEFQTDKERHVFASYDDEPSSWGNTHRDAWEAIGKRDFVAGSFVWTGFDYRGEPSPHEWPSVSSFFGIMDLNGFPKTAYYMHQVQWIKDRPLIHIAPHWNWPDKVGKPVRVMVMANTETVKLLLNGQEIGTQKADPYRMNSFQVTYAPGKLEAIGYNGGKEVVRSAVETTGPAVALELVPDRDWLTGDGQDAMPITVRAVDASGRAVPTAAPLATFTVSGAGRSIGHGNGDPNSHEDEKAATRSLFNGLAQLIIQTNDASEGSVQVEATAPGLAAARVSIPVRKGTTLKYVPVTRSASFYLQSWLVSPASASRPDPNYVLSPTDMNSWAPASPAMVLNASAKPVFQLYRTKFQQTAALNNARLTLEWISGKAEVWLDGKLIGTKNWPGASGFEVDLPNTAGARELTVLIENQPADPSGILGKVRAAPKQ
jgi:beta-galactosidase